MRKRVSYLNERNSNHKYIKHFNPDISVLDTECRDYFDFNAGEGNENFNDFLMYEADKYRLDGNGVTYGVWNVLEEKDKENSRDIVAYFTLSANAIPYIDRIMIDESEILMSGEKFDEENWGISVLEIKMFAVDDNYQDGFYTFEEQALPIAVWCLYAIINYANTLLSSVLGFKALFLHSVPEAEKFYLRNGFREMRVNMHPFACIDSEMRPMWLPLRDIHMNYEK